MEVNNGLMQMVNYTETMKNQRKLMKMEVATGISMINYTETETFPQ
jgi:hypothetical protein